MKAKLGATLKESLKYDNIQNSSIPIFISLSSQPK